MNKTVSIILLNYCSYNNTCKCVNSIINSDIKYDYKIVIVDNNSYDESGNRLEKKYQNDSRIVVIKHSNNKGYSAGNNVGLEYSIKNGFDYIIISNPDIIFLPDSITQMCDSFEIDTKIGLVAPKILNYDKTTYCYSPRKKKTDLSSLYLLKKPLSLFNLFDCKGKMFYSQKEHEKELFVFSVSGSCFCLNKNAAKDLYPLDENTFMYMEETIIGICMAKLGYKSYYTPRSIVIHNHKDSKKVPNKKLIRFRRNSEMYYAKRYLRCNRIKLLPLLIYYDFAYSISLLGEKRKK